MGHSPLVSILIPAHNAEKTISAAINSCLNQSYDLIEVLVLNNASTDNTQLVIDGFKDKRLHSYSSSEKGIAKARNLLVSKAKGKYIAWLDADDISMSKRIEKQLDFMEDYPEVDVLGTYVKVRGSSKISAVKRPCGNDALQAWLKFRNPFVQSSLMIRSTAKPSYNSDFDYIEDYHWVFQNKENLELQILPEFLCSYFQSDEEIASKKLDYKQQENLFKLWQHWSDDKSETFEHLFSFMRNSSADQPNKVFTDIKNLFKRGIGKEEKAILLLQGIRLFRSHPSFGIALFCISNILLIPKALAIRPKFIK